MKTEDETLGMAKRWMAETADIHKNYPLLIIVLGNAGENTSKELNDYCNEHGVKN